MGRGGVLNGPDRGVPATQVTMRTDTACPQRQRWSWDCWRVLPAAALADRQTGRLMEQ